MPNTVVLGRWGKSLALRIPADIAGSLSLSEGDTIDLEQQSDSLVLRRVRRPTTLEDLFEGHTAEEWRQIYRDHTFDWGPDQGREVVEE